MHAEVSRSSATPCLRVRFEQFDRGDEEMSWLAPLVVRPYPSKARHNVASIYCTLRAASSSISFHYMPYDREKQKKREGPRMVAQVSASNRRKGAGSDLIGAICDAGATQNLLTLLKLAFLTLRGSWFQTTCTGASGSSPSTGSPTLLRIDAERCCTTRISSVMTSCFHRPRVHCPVEAVLPDLPQRNEDDK
jgi:hypothetical protein